MARYVYRSYRKLNGDVVKILKQHTSNGSLEILKRRKLKPLHNREEMQRIISKERKRVKTPIVISAKHFKGKRANADGLATRPRGKSKILLHPVIAYYPRKHIKNLIDHEKDHINNYENRDYQTRF